jgi:hypothetical protein
MTPPLKNERCWPFGIPSKIGSSLVIQVTDTGIQQRRIVVEWASGAADMKSFPVLYSLCEEKNYHERVE